MRVDGDQPAVDVGNLTQIISVFRQFLFFDFLFADFFRPDHVTRFQHLLNRFRRPADPLIGQRFACPGKNGKRNDAGFAVNRFNLRPRIVDQGHHRLFPAAFGSDRQCRFFQYRHIIVFKSDVGRCPAPAVAAVILLQFFPEYPGGDFLQTRINGGADDQPALVKRLGTETPFNSAADFLAEIFRMFYETAVAFHHFQRLRLGVFGRKLVNIPLLKHPADHPVAAGHGRLVTGVGIVIVGSLRQRRQIGGFLQRQFRQRLVKIVERRCRHAVRAVAEVNFVQIQFQNMIFAKRLFNPPGQKRFLDFADIRHFRRKQKVFGHLLGDGRRTRRPATAAQVFHVADNGADNADIINPRMPIKLFVFGGDERLLDQIGDFADRHEQPLLHRVFLQQLTVAGIQAGGDRRLVFFQLAVIGQALAEAPQIADDHDNQDDRKKEKRAQ